MLLCSSSPKADLIGCEYDSERTVRAMSRRPGRSWRIEPERAPSYTDRNYRPGHDVPLFVRVVAYLRVSTDRQAEEGLGLDVQQHAIRTWAKKHGHRVVAWTRDEGVSGTNGLDGRVGLAEALEAVRERRAEALVIYRLDRLARDLVLQEQLLAEVRRLGGVVLSASESESAFLVDDPDDPSRKLIRQVLGAVSEYERSMIALCLRSGRARTRAGRCSTTSRCSSIGDGCTPRSAIARPSPTRTRSATTTPLTRHNQHVRRTGSTPVVVLWGGYEANDVGVRVVDGVTVLRGAELRRWLRSLEPRALTSDQQEQAWKKLEATVRGRDAFDLREDGPHPRSPGDWARLIVGVMFALWLGLLAAANAWAVWRSFPLFFTADALFAAIGCVVLKRTRFVPVAIAWLAGVLFVGVLVAAAALSSTL